MVVNTNVAIHQNTDVSYKNYLDSVLKVGSLDHGNDFIGNCMNKKEWHEQLYSELFTYISFIMLYVDGLQCIVELNCF